MSSAVNETFSRLNAKQSEIKGGCGKVAPGEPFYITHAWDEGDAGRQGDLYLVKRSRVTPGYIRQENPSLRLVPGSSIGASHRLASLEGVEVWYPSEFSLDDLNATVGPELVFRRGNVIEHDRHGNAIIEVTPGDSIVIGCEYQVEGDREARRVRD